MKECNILSGIRASISEDKQCVKIELVDKTISENEDNSIFATFIIQASSYQEIIQAFVNMGMEMQITHDVDLGFRP